MDKKHMTPVEIAIAEFGGVRKLARSIDRDPAAVSRWKKSGCVPTNVQRSLLETAWGLGIKLTAHQIIFGKIDD
jgi:hypothetical protein